MYRGNGADEDGKDREEDTSTSMAWFKLIDPIVYDPNTITKKVNAYDHNKKQICRRHQETRGTRALCDDNIVTVQGVVSI